jgi:hypothetical protein
MRPDCLDDPFCHDCGGLITSELLAEPRHDDGFGVELCDCVEAALSVAVEGLYSPVRDTRDLGYVGDDENADPSTRSVA